MHAFYLPPEKWPGAHIPSLTLTGQEAHHLHRVLRLRPGEDVVVLDGAGREAVCRLSRVSGQTADLDIVRLMHHPAPQARVILAAGWGKAARRGWILEKAVELEASALWFWQAERSQFPVPDDIRSNWHAQLVAGAKQCRNPWIPELRTMPGGVTELIKATPPQAHKHVLVENDHPHQSFLTSDKLAQPGDTLCVVGPEGGFTAKEVQALSAAGFEALSMGARILRWETAALMALGLHWWKRQEGSA